MPPKRRMVELSTCEKDWKRRSSRLAGMPMPVSRTRTRNEMRARSPRVSPSTVSTTSPEALNLMALPMRLSSTCLSRMAFETSAPGVSGAIS